MDERSNRHKKPFKLNIATYGILLLVTVVVWTDRSETFIPEWPFVSPVWSVPCPGGVKNVVFVPGTTLSQPYFVTSAVWSSNGKYLSVGSEFERNINIYDTSTWKIISHFVRDGAAGDNNSVIQFDNVNSTLLVPRILTPYNEDVSVEDWDLNRGRSIQKYLAVWPQNRSLIPFSDERDSRAKAIGVSASGRLIAASVGGGGNGYVIIYDWKNANVVQEIECAKYNVPTSLSFSEDDNVILVGGCHLYDVEGYSVKTGRRVFQTQVDYGNWLYNFTSYSPSGSLIAVGSSNAEHGTVTILQSLDGSIVKSFPTVHANITNLQWVNENLILASYDAWHPGGSVAKLWDIKTGSMVAEIEGVHLQFAAISPNGHQLAAVIGNKVIIGNFKKNWAGINTPRSPFPSRLVDRNSAS